jgi:hypothetical protein
MTERAHEIELPAMDTGSPSPVLIWGGITALLYYGPRTTSDEVVILEFIGGLAAKCGLPSDESLMGHRLFGKGLQFYAAHEVEDSEWLRELEAKAPHRASPGWIRSHRHYLFTFHDETVECLARDVIWRRSGVSMDAALAELIRGHQL